MIDEHCRTALDGAIGALADVGNPLRLNFFSTALRILYERTMRKLAPKSLVKRSPWFESELDSGNPTRAQRIHYAIQGGLADDFLRTDLWIDIDLMRKALVKAVDNFGKYVHGDEGTILVDEATQDREAASMIAALTAFLDSYAACRSAIVEPNQDKLDEAAVDKLLEETTQAVDELATHHSVDEIYVASTVVLTIGVADITYWASGTLNVGLQWGSNSHLRNDDGGEIDQSFSFVCDFTVPLEDPWDLASAETTFAVDTSEWIDAMRPDE